MSPNAGDIRAGGVYYEIGGTNAPLIRSLAQSQARLRSWAAESQPYFTKANESALSGGAGDRGGFFSGNFRGMNLLGDSGLRFAVAVQEARVAIKDVQIFAALARGDFDGMRKVAETLPFGLGEVVKELGAAADAAAKWVGAYWGHDMVGAYDSAATARAERDRKASAEAHNRGLQAIKDADRAWKKATLSAADYARWTVAGMNLVGSQADELLEKLLRLASAENPADKTFEKNNQRMEDMYNRSEAADRRRQDWTKAQADAAARDAERWVAEAEEGMRRHISLTEELFPESDLERELERNSRQREEADRLRESLRTPAEQARDEIEHLEELLAGGDISQATYGRGVQKSLEEAAARLPDAIAGTIGVRGTFNAMAAAGLAGGGASDRIAAATEKTAKNTEKIAQLAKDWGLKFD